MCRCSPAPIFEMAAFVLLALSHNDPLSIYAGSALLGLGLAFSFAACATLLVEAVPQQQTGVATGMHTVFRNVGGAFGTQIAATILAAEAVGSLPTEQGFVIAFLVGGVISAGALAIALAVPRRPRERLEPAVVPAG